MVRLGTAILLFVVVAASAHAQPMPSFSAQPGGVVAAVLPAAILSRADVRKQLGSGLTTTFLAVTRQRGTEMVSASRLEIRYDLWDEVWLVRRVELGRRSEQQRLTSMEALEAWWKTPLRLIALRGERASLQVEMSVLPFSAAEESDARQWISKSGGVGTAADSSGIVDALIGTTIAARPITSFRWTAEVALK